MVLPSLGVACCPTEENQPQSSCGGNPLGGKKAAPLGQSGSTVLLEAGRVERPRSSLKCLWTETNFCNVRIRQRRSMARSRVRRGRRAPSFGCPIAKLSRPARILTFGTYHRPLRLVRPPPFHLRRDSPQLQMALAATYAPDRHSTLPGPPKHRRAVGEQTSRQSHWPLQGPLRCAGR